MIKTLLKILLTLVIYEAVKYITYQVIIIKQANDEVEIPSDFNINDHIHLNDLKAEVSD